MVVETAIRRTLKAMIECSTKSSIGKNLSLQELASLVAEEWEEASGILPADLEQSAGATRALVRRRGIRCALDLLRIALAYAVCDWSFRVLGIWCVLWGLGDLSDVALLNRLRHCDRWLGTLIVQLLQRGRVPLSPQAGVRLRLVDATIVSQPGSQGTDWRVHLSLDLGRLCLDGVAVTSADGGESLARFPSQPGDIVVADRGYAFPRSVGAVSATPACGLVVRSHWHNLRWEDDQGQRRDVIAWLQESACGEEKPTAETAVWLSTPQGRFSLRLIAWVLPQEAAERARQRARQTAKRKGRTPDERNLYASGFILLLTNLPPSRWSANQILDLYRLRWQMEMWIKRSKSIFTLDGLRARDPHLAQTYLLGKLLGALLIDLLTQKAVTRVPDWFATCDRPPSPWRLATLLWEHLQSLVRGPVSLARLILLLPRLQRFLCDPPRKRRQQLAYARTLLAHLSVC